MDEDKEREKNRQKACIVDIPIERVKGRENVCVCVCEF